MIHKFQNYIKTKEFKYFTALLIAALSIGVINNLTQDKKLGWFTSPEVLEKPPELQEETP